MNECVVTLILRVTRVTYIAEMLSKALAGHLNFPLGMNETFMRERLWYPNINGINVLLTMRPSGPEHT